MGNNVISSTHTWESQGFWTSRGSDSRRHLHFPIFFISKLLIPIFILILILISSSHH
ncbi:hypothetical protein Hanom_Chr09g00841871 [Helianthus anomalus]